MSHSTMQPRIVLAAGALAADALWILPRALRVIEAARSRPGRRGRGDGLRGR